MRTPDFLTSTMTVFELFGLQHWLSSGVTIGLAVLLPLLVRQLTDDKLKKILAKALALCMASYLVASPIIRSGVYGFLLRESLPLHLCGASVALGVLMLWLRSFQVYEVVYFWGIGGVVAALLTPDLQDGFPHPLFLIFFTGHGLALTGVMYATFVFGFRPRPRSVGIAIGATAVYALAMLPVNLLLGSNYLYLVRKPFRPSPLDYMGPWPWYILGLAGLVIAACLLCYLPFTVQDRLRRSASKQE
jgi:hypothetical integral membrane protein (TIGR02206 family)